MPIVSTVQVTSFVQFDGDQSTAVHTRTVVEISEDGDVLIEDSAEIDNALSGVCVRQSAQVDTESSQMLLHSETQQDKPEFDPKAPPNDVTVEQKSDLVEDDDDTKEAQTNVTIGPEHGRSRITERSPCCATDTSEQRKSLTDESSLTHVSDLEKSLEQISVAVRDEKPAPDAGNEQQEPREGRDDPELDSSAEKKKQSPVKDFDIGDVEGIDYESKKALQETGDKETQEHGVDMTRVKLPKVIDLLGSIRKGPADVAKTPMQANPLDEDESEAAVEQLHRPTAAPEPSLPLAVDPLDESLSADSIRRRSLTQLGARPKRSALDLLSDDTPSRSAQQIKTESISVAKLRSSPGEHRKVSFNTKPATQQSPKVGRAARDDSTARLTQPKTSPSDEDRFEDLTENVFKPSEEQIAKKAVVRNLRKQFRPSLGVRAKIKKPSIRQYSEDETRSSSRISKSAKPKRVVAETETPSTIRKISDKDVLRKYTSNE